MNTKEMREKLYDSQPKFGIKMRMAAKIKEMRNAAQLTQLQLAKTLGTKQENIARWEAGRHEPSLSTLKRIADATGFKMELPVFAPLRHR